MTAGDMTKIALILLRNNLLNNNIRPLQNAAVKLVNAIHDEIIIEASDELIEEYSKLQKKCMEEAGSILCKKVKVTTSPIISSYWIH